MRASSSSVLRIMPRASPNPAPTISPGPSPRSPLKLTPSTNMMFTLEVDTYNGKNRGASATTAPNAVVNQKSPEVVTNFSLTHIFSPKTFIDVKAAYFWGYYYLEPETGRDTYCHFDSNENMLKYNSGYYYLGRPHPAPGERQPDPLCRGLHQRQSRLQVRRRGRTFDLPEPLRLHGEGRAARR